MAMDYSTFVSTIANLSALDPTMDEFIQIMPRVIEYAEDRIYREMDFLDTVYVNSTGTLLNGNREFTIPAISEGVKATVTGVNILYTDNQRQVLQPVAVSYLNYVWGSPTIQALPEYFAMLRQDTILVGPFPDQSYQVEVFGTFQPTPMSATNPTTILTTYVPDLLVAAGMIFTTGYMKDFGSQSDNPQAAQSWETQYQGLFKSAMMLELRKKFAGPGWTSLSSLPITPTR